MINNKLLKIAFENYDTLKKISISKRQHDLITYLKDRKVTSADIAKKHNISVQNASQQLTNLHNKGYLTREEFVAETGGYIYEYTANKLLFK